jgi:DNA-binding NtrC family response regulator
MPDDQPQSTIGLSLSGVASAFLPGSYVLVFSENSSTMVPLPAQGDLSIGRGDGCEIRIDDARVSRAHARLESSAGTVRLVDLGSQNGTFVNNERVSGTRTLTSGDSIVVGKATLLFHAPVVNPRRNAPIEREHFRPRLELEVERARQFARPLAVASIIVPTPQTRAAAERLLADTLRPIDISTWATTTELVLCLPECSVEEATATVSDLLAELPSTRAGISSCPRDAVEATAVLEAARASAVISTAGAVAQAATAFQTHSVLGHHILIADPVMIRLYELVRRLADSELSVLIAGETGTGKELVASALHAFSRRVGQRLVAVNCAALSESLLESELFGHAKGAFTGALTAKTGFFEAAQGGTLFLDEIAEMSLSLQAKLLRALETKRITPVGDTNERAIDIRVVAASHRDLSIDVREGRFRQDLYFRLSGATVWIPPLRSRQRELPLLARRFLGEASTHSNRPVPLLSDSALSVLCSHPWQGNVRELKNVMNFLAATVTEPIIEAWHVSERLGERPPVPPESPDDNQPSGPQGVPRAFRALAEEVRELEERRMVEALESTDWNQTRAAAVLSMPLRTFVTRFKQFDLGRRKPKA